MAMVNNALDRAAFLEDLQWLLDTGVKEREELARRLDITVDTLERRLQRWDMPNLLDGTYRYNESVSRA